MAQGIPLGVKLWRTRDQGDASKMRLMLFYGAVLGCSDPLDCSSCLTIVQSCPGTIFICICLVVCVDGKCGDLLVHHIPNVTLYFSS